MSEAHKGDIRRPGADSTAADPPSSTSPVPSPPASALRAAAAPARATPGLALPLAASLAVLWGLVAVLLAAVHRATGGHFAYVLDDPYLHLAMARNLARHGVWGLFPNQFTNTSSSPIWTLLVAAIFKVTGPLVLVPFLLNVVFASGLLVAVARALRPVAPSRFFLFLVLFAITIWTPLPSLIFTGQEHLLHALVSFGFLLAMGRIVAGDGRQGEPANGGSPGARTMDESTKRPRGTLSKVDRSDQTLLLASSALLPLIRYEGLFLCAVGAGMLFLSGRRRLAALSAVVAVVPIALFGAFSAAHGWFWLPNPILLKGNLPPGHSLSALFIFAKAWYSQMMNNGHMLYLVVGSLAILAVSWGRRRAGDPFPFMLAAVIVATLLHLQFAKLRWFYRYEAYLVVLSLFAMAGTGAGFLRGRWSGLRPSRARGPSQAAGFILFLLVFVALSNRASEAIPRVPRAARNIWQQQVQMGLFLKQFYPRASIAANDLGAISWLADTQCLDLWGLASIDVARARRSGTYDRDTIDRLTREHGCRIGIVYDSWWNPGDYGGIAAGRQGGLPANWVQAGRWTIPDNVVCGSPTVSFYAIDPAEAPALEEHSAGVRAAASGGRAGGRGVPAAGGREPSLSSERGAEPGGVVLCSLAGHRR